MKIGMVSACDTSVINGVTRMIQLYEQELTRQGHEVTLFTWGNRSQTSPTIIRSWALPLGKTGYYASWGYGRQAQRHLQEMDVLHCHHLFMSVEMARRYAHCPIIYTNHTSYDAYTATYTPLPTSLANQTMKVLWPRFAGYADVVIAPSQSIKQRMIKFGVKRPIELIPNGINLAKFTPFLNAGEGNIHLIYVGRLAPEKNIPQLLQQFQIAQKQQPNLHLTLVGDGPQKHKLESLSIQLGIRQQVHFAGAVPYEHVSTKLAQADIFVTASTSEVHPLTVIEAMASGLPVIAPRSPALAETVQDGVSGMLVDGFEGMATAVTHLASHPDKRQQMGANARQQSQQYDIKNTVQQTLNLYKRLLTKTRDPQYNR